MAIIGTPISVEITEEEIIKALNMRAQEFEAGVILQKIEIAGITIDAINRHGATGDIVRVAKIHMAAYLSYLAYCDAPANKLPGSIDPETGKWTPVGDPDARIHMAAKLAALKKVSDEATNTMLNTTDRPTGYAPAFGRMHVK